MSQLLVTLIAMHANRFDKAGNERLLEQRAHQDAGEESPFELPSEQFRRENRTPPDDQAPATSTTNIRSRHTHT